MSSQKDETREITGAHTIAIQAFNFMRACPVYN
jgi:hypothetical protein